MYDDDVCCNECDHYDPLDGWCGLKCCYKKPQDGLNCDDFLPQEDVE